ncbi:MAG TPA: YsnF/AvaK domain-containing protein, partial [Phormidium sp.]
LCRIDFPSNRVYATSLRSKEQAERLPRYEDGMSVDYDYEEQVRNVYRTPSVEASPPVEASLPVESTGIVDATAPVSRPQPVVNQAPDTTYDRQAYTYEKEPAMYQTNVQDHQELKLYEERLVASTSRRKAGEVTIGKHIETETVKTTVPVEKERVVIERTTPIDTAISQLPGDAFQGQQAMRMEIYEETADIKKEAFVREEINIRKEVARDTVEVKDTVRREELDLDTEGSSTINQLHSPNDH